MRSAAKPVTTTASVEPDGGEVAERDVEDRAVAVDGQQRLGQLGGVLAEPASRARRQHHPDHSPSSSVRRIRRPSPGCARSGRHADDGLGHEHGAEQRRPRRRRRRERAEREQHPGEDEPPVPAARRAGSATRGGHLGAVAQAVDEVVVAERRARRAARTRPAGASSSAASQISARTRRARTSGGTAQRKLSLRPARRSSSPTVSSSHATHRGGERRARRRRRRTRPARAAAPTPASSSAIAGTGSARPERAAERARERPVVAVDLDVLGQRRALLGGGDGGGHRAIDRSTRPLRVYSDREAAPGRAAR